jgi:predicted transposase YbfD/YdcC
MPRRRGARPLEHRKQTALVFDVTLREDECRMRKDHSARNLAMIRRAVLNILQREPSKFSL